MSNSFALAAARARESHAEEWEAMTPGARTAAIFHEMCRIDSKCQRTGTATDANLPPCLADDTFIARRACRFAGRRDDP